MKEKRDSSLGELELDKLKLYFKREAVIYLTAFFCYNKVMKKYRPKTAGFYLNDKVPVVLKNKTVADVEELIKNRVSSFETINYIYVVNNQQNLLGVFSIKELFKADKKIRLIDLIKKELVYAYASTSQERVASLALRHSLKAVPIVNRQKHFLGVVASDDILKILDEELTDNILKLGGISENHKENVFSLSIAKSIKHRLPWLIIGLFGGIFTASLVANFEEVLSQNLILAAFIPLLVYMSGAVSAQMQTFIIRDLFLNHHLKFLKYFLRQAIIVSSIGLIISLLLYFISYLLYQQASLSFILSLSLLLSIISALITGLIFPYIFNRLKLDPADISGPIATIIQDIFSILLYFLIASWCL